MLPSLSHFFDFITIPFCSEITENGGVFAEEKTNAVEA